MCSHNGHRFFADLQPNRRIWGHLKTNCRIHIFDRLQLISQYREMEENFSGNCNVIFFSKINLRLVFRVFNVSSAVCNRL